jgi:hypothetical protein
MTDYKDLAEQAARAINFSPYEVRTMHGVEIADGFFNVYNQETGQSKTVVFHPESGMVFKLGYGPRYSTNHSGRVIGEVRWDGVTYPVRLPIFDYFDTAGGWVEMQECIEGAHCGCDGYGRCEHMDDMETATKCGDTHRGNWKIAAHADEVILFDFDGMPLD